MRHDAHHEGPAIEVAGLTKRYGDHEAVRGISFTVRRGEVFCLLGPNGAGKTTTTEVLEGYRERTSGTVRVLGMDPAGQPRALRERIGIVLQECGVQGDLTVGEVLAMYGSYCADPRPVGELLELVGLEGSARARVGTLSGGQRRRLDVALALVGRPELVFLDEPTTGFDPTARRQSWELVRRLCSMGSTVLLTTHFMDEAEYLADRIAVVQGGRIVAEGTPRTLGGRDAAATRIRFLPVGGAAPSELAAVAGAPVRADGADWVLDVADPTVALQRLTSWAGSRGVRLEGLSVAQPSLEDVYLSLIGAAA